MLLPLAEDIRKGEILMPGSVPSQNLHERPQAPSTYAVVVTYNGQNDIIQCLTSLLASTVPVRILVIDNHSADNTVKIIRRDFPEVDVMCSTENLGFGKANNIGMKYAYESGAEHVFLLNQDAFVDADTIRRLRDLQVAHEEFALLSPLQLDGTGNRLDQKFASHLAKSGSIANILSDTMVSAEKSDLYEVDFVNAAAWMLSRRCVEEVGLFNPVFEHYGEDCEYAHRVWQKGFKAGLALQATACHNRAQNEPVMRDFHRTLMIEKALIRYRLCRKVPGTTINILSAFSRALFVQGQTKTDSFRLRLQLLGFLVGGMLKILKMRDKGYASQCAFFDSTRNWPLINR